MIANDFFFVLKEGIFIKYLFFVFCAFMVQVEKSPEVNSIKKI